MDKLFSQISQLKLSDSENLNKILNKEELVKF